LDTCKWFADPEKLSIPEHHTKMTIYPSNAEKKLLLFAFTRMGGLKKHTIQFESYICGVPDVIGALAV